MTTQITIEDYFMDRADKYAADLTDEIRSNAAETVSRINLLLFLATRAGILLIASNGRSLVNSGWRPPAINDATPKAAKRSLHMTAQACDISDPRGDLDKWCLANPGILKEIGLWQEHPSSTPKWTHLQIVPPKSGNRVFYP